MSAFVLLPELLGLTASEAAGFAVGTATAFVLRPVVQIFENEAWAHDPTKPLAAQIAAAIVAENVADYQWGENEAGNTGVDPTRFEKLYGETLNAPGLAELYAAWRRAGITDTDFVHGLRKAKLEDRWDEALKALKHAKLAPAQVALGIVRTVLDDAGLLAAKLDTSGGVVPAYRVSDIDPVVEAEAWGIDRERLRVLVGEIGLPMSAQQAASAFFRKIIERTDYNRAIVEGDTRPEWGEFILEQARAILSPNQYAELELRGFLTETERRDKTDQYGMSHADSDLLYNLLGRSIPVHQITTGRARGGTYNGATADIPNDYLASLERGNLRKEYFNLAYANRYSYPSAFVVRALLTDGTISESEGEQIFLDVGWTPSLAKKVATHYAGGTVAKADPHVTKANNSLWTTMHRSYIAQESDAAALDPGFTLLGVPVGARTEILAAFDAERALIRKQLTPAQIKKAFDKAAVNDATGQPWTHDDALAALLERGYSGEQARSYLNIPSGK